jgi:hypothetical protein
MHKIAIRYREHIRYIKYNNVQSAYAKHILQNQHEYCPTEQTMELLKKKTKGRKRTHGKITIYNISHIRIEKQICAKHKPLFQLAHSTHATRHTADTHSSQSLPENRAGTTRT